VENRSVGTGGRGKAIKTERKGELERRRRRKGEGGGYRIYEITLRVKNVVELGVQELKCILREKGGTIQRERK
jgi:hypothetical protein